MDSEEIQQQKPPVEQWMQKLDGGRRKGGVVVSKVKISGGVTWVFAPFETFTQ